MMLLETTRRRFMLGLGATGAVAVIPMNLGSAATSRASFRFDSGITMKVHGRSLSLPIWTNDRPDILLLNDQAVDLRISISCQPLEMTMPYHECRIFKPGSGHMEIDYRGFISNDICNKFRSEQPVKMAVSMSGQPGYYVANDMLIDEIAIMSA